MRSKGVHRLSILLGILGLLGWTIFLFSTSEGFPNATGLDWVLIIGTIPVSFLVPFFLVRGIAWVSEGFKDDKNRP